MPLKWIEAHGRAILLVDNRGLRVEQMLELLEEVRAVILAAQAKPLVLFDFTDAPMTTEYLNRAQQIGRELLGRPEKIAAVGTTGLKAMFLSAYLSFTGSQTTRPFATEAEALAWLCEPLEP